MNKVRSAILGFPRIGANRELKRAVESFWKREIKEDDLLNRKKDIITNNINMQKEAGISYGSSCFSMDDHVLDMALTVGAVPSRYQNILNKYSQYKLTLPWLVACRIKSKMLQQWR